MKNRAMLRSSLREIIQTKARFISILGIIFLGVAFFVGLGATGPDMLQTADNYYERYHLADQQIISPLGLTEDDLERLQSWSGIEEVQEMKFADINLQDKNEVVRFFSYDCEQKINQYNVVEGQLPEKKGEIALDNRVNFWGDYRLGDSFTVADSDDSDDQLKNREYKIVGFVNSPAYVENVSRGNTSAGSGSIDYFAVVAAADFDLDIFTSILVRYKNLSDQSAYSEKYQALLEDNQQQLETLLADRPQERLQEIKAEAQKEIEQAKQDVAEGEQALTDAEQKLSDSRLQLDDARAQLETAQNELNNRIGEAQNQLTIQESQLVTGQNEVSRNQQELAVQKQNLQSMAGDIERARQGVNDLTLKRNEAAAGLTELSNTYNAVSAVIANLAPFLSLPDEEFELMATEIAGQVGALLGELPSEISGGLQNFVVDPTKANLEAGLAPLYPIVQQLEAQIAEVQAGINEIDASLAEINHQIQQYENGLAQISNGEAQISEAQNQINVGWGQIEEAQIQLAQAQSEGQAQIDIASQELADGEQTYQEGYEKYQQELAENRPKLEDAKQEIADQEQELNELVAEDYIFMARENNPGYAEYEENAKRISSLATVFPMIFFLIAALVSLTTMTRMVEEKRLEIGTFKALGYKNSAISMKFLLYSFIAGALGVLFGLALGFYLFPNIIFSAYGQLYNIDEFVTPWYWEYSLIGLLVSIVCTVGTALIVLRIDLLSTPAVLMRPKAPKAGKRILLERIKPVWKRINFIQKVTMRNLFRYKQRMLMTILGIAGCMSMIITGFGLRDSISDIVTIQFDKIWHYRGIVSFTDDVNQEELDSYYTQLAELPDYQDNMPLSSNTLELIKSGKTNQNVTVYAPEYPDKISDFILFNNRETGQKYQLNDDGAFINEKLANLYDLKTGDTLTLTDSDNQTYPLKIEAIVENYTGHFAFMTPVYYQKVFGEELQYNTDFLLFNRELTSNQETKIAETLMESDQIVNVSFLTQSRDALDDTINSLNIVVWVLIVSAGLLAFIVLYNLTNINVSERIRELSTIKVLGFYDNELTMYVYRENIILTFLGIFIGLFLGKLEHAYVLQTVEVDLIMFSPRIHWISYVYASLITIFFTVIVGIVMYFKLKRVDMIEALKSNE